jgi:hypothetical protein
MYMPKPTRYIWHDRPQTIFEDKRWMVVPLDLMDSPGALATWIERDMTYMGECSERLTLDEFRVRLKKTLDFLRQNERPNWQTVVAENEAFLKSIDEPARY